MAKAINRVQVLVECTSCRENDLPGVSRYSTIENKRNTTSRLEIKKYCRFEKKHTLHRESK